MNEVPGPIVLFPGFRVQVEVRAVLTVMSKGVS